MKKIVYSQKEYIELTDDKDLIIKNTILESGNKETLRLINNNIFGIFLYIYYEKYL